MKKDFKSIGAQFRRDDTSRKKIFEASEKKIQTLLRRLTDVGENKQLESRLRALIQEEGVSLCQSSEKRLTALIEQATNTIASSTSKSDSREIAENGNAWERSVVPRPGKRKRNAITGSQLSICSQNMDNLCCEEEGKRKCVDEVSNRILEVKQHRENASNLFLIDDFF